MRVIIVFLGESNKKMGRVDCDFVILSNFGIALSRIDSS